MPTPRPEALEQSRKIVARRARELRVRAGQTQAELARYLGLSQNRLSEIERGQGSFTAEQLFVMASLFEVDLADFFTQKKAIDVRQSALAGLGASHLMAAEERPLLRSPHTVVRETLSAADSARQLASLAPVLVAQIERVNLGLMLRELQARNQQQRLGWLVDSVVAAIQSELEQEVPWALRQRYRRTLLVLQEFRALRLAPLLVQELREDILDQDIMTHKTLLNVRGERSPIAATWGIMTRIETDTFIAALRDNRRKLSEAA